MISLTQLLSPVSEDDLLAYLLGTLDSLGFQATSWQSGSVARTTFQVLARFGADLSQSIASMASGGYAGLATGPYADLAGQYQFKLTRVPASSTVGQMVLTSSAAAPPHTFATGELLISDGAFDSSANTYQLVSGPGAGPWTLAPASTMLITVAAAVPGAKANALPPNSATLTLLTPLVGVTVSNPPNPPTTPVNTWITAPGVDVETDGPSGRYNARMLGRWDRLTYSNTAGAYRAWVLEALPAVTRLSVREGSTPFSVHIVCATALGGIDAGQISDLELPERRD